MAGVLSGSEEDDSLAKRNAALTSAVAVHGTLPAAVQAQEGGAQAAPSDLPWSPSSSQCRTRAGQGSSLSRTPRP